MSDKEYEENEQMKLYVLNHYTQHFTELEALCFKVIHAEQKAQNSTKKMAMKLREKWGQLDNSDVVAALSDGSDVFYSKVYERLMEKHAGHISINRCPSCNRIARTPKAKQCQWCFKTWH